MISLDKLSITSTRVIALSVAMFLAAAALALPASAGGRAAPASSHKAATEVSAKLNGDREVPGPGDPNGRGSVTVRLRAAAGKVCAHATWKRIGAPIAAHIHKGGPRVSGDVVVDLTGAVTGGSHCATGVSRRTINKIAMHPNRYYFNIHTGAFQAGAIRGQLHR
jgi:hypothetical protein